LVIIIIKIQPCNIRIFAAVESKPSTLWILRRMMMDGFMDRMIKDDESKMDNERMEALAAPSKSSHAPVAAEMRGG
jgi:hypothetical protein